MNRLENNGVGAMDSALIRIAAIDFRGSVCDGPGVRTVVYLQGCNRKCKKCHNPSTWPINGGTLLSTDELVSQVVSSSRTKRITISGGEPLLQISSLTRFIKALNENGFDIALYTGFHLEEVPQSILMWLQYIKVGKYEEDKRTTTMPFIGSTNQKFIELKGIQHG